MSKHVWEIKKPVDPMGEASYLYRAFYLAAENRFSLEDSARIACYGLERCRQSIYTSSPQQIVQGAMASGGRCCKGRNRDNYLKGFCNRASSIATYALSQAIKTLGLDPSTPWQIAADYAMDHDHWLLSDVLKFLFRMK